MFSSLSDWRILYSTVLYPLYSGMRLRKLGDCLDRCGIFRRCHSGQLFELPWKIMNWRISQKIRNLGKIHIVFTDKLFGKVDFHAWKNSITPHWYWSRKLLKLWTTDYIAFWDSIDRHGLPDMLLKIMNDIAAGFRSGLAGIIDTGGGRIMSHRIAPDNMNQQFFEI